MKDITDFKNAPLTFKSSCIVIVISINPWLRIFVTKLVISPSLLWVREYCKCIAYGCVKQQNKQQMLHNNTPFALEIRFLLFLEMNLHMHAVTCTCVMQVG